MIAAFLGRVWGWLAAAAGLAVAVVGAMTWAHLRGRRQGAEGQELEYRREADAARERMDQVDVPRSRRDLVERLRRR